MVEHSNELEKLKAENERLTQLLNIKNRKSNSDLEQKYLSLFTKLKDVVYESTHDGRLIDINPSGLELFGYSSKEELLKVNIASDLYVNPERRAVLLKKLEENGFVKDYEIKVKNKDGNEIVVLETSFQRKDVDGNVLGYTGIIRDVTKSKKHELLLTKYNEDLAKVNEQLKSSERKLKKLNDEKDKFFSIIAHDLKSPFNALLNLSEFLVEDLSELSLEEIRSFSKEINKSAHSVYNLLLNLLQWAQIKNGWMKRTEEKIALSSLLNNVIILMESVATKKRIEIINDVNSTCFFYGDRTMISSVLQNLISNAIKFSKREGKVIVSSKIEDEKIIVSVKDTGVGICDENLDKLFRLDNHLSTAGTANESGTGLGLILCKELVEKNNGQIWVDSEERIGTTFSFSLDKTEV